MKLCYIAGPYRSKTQDGVAYNVNAARAVALKYMKLGYAVICPHSNTAFMDSMLPDEFFLSMDICLMKRCDVVVAMKTYSESAGALYEIELAEELEIPIIYDDGRPGPASDQPISALLGEK